MKRIKTFLILILIIVMAACHNNEEETIIEKQINPYESVGIEHNKILENAYNKLKEFKKLKQSGRTNNDSIQTLSDDLNIIGKSSIKYSLENNSDFSEKGKSFVENNANNAEELINEYSYINHDSVALHQKIISDLNVMLTPTQRMYINKIFTSISSNNNVNTILSELYDIQVEISANCSGDEMITLLSNVAVAKHSLMYWNDNYQKWLVEFGASEINNNTNAKTEGDIRRNWVVGADAGAAVGIGVVASPALSVPFIGWGAYLGGVAVGAGIASAGSALIQLYGRQVYEPPLLDLNNIPRPKAGGVLGRPTNQILKINP